MLKRVLRPCWPKFAIWRIVALAACGLALLSLSIRDLVRLQTEGNTTGITDDLARGLACLGFSMMFLISALWASMLRYYGLLLRKLSTKVTP